MPHHYKLFTSSSQYVFFTVGISALAFGDIPYLYGLIGGIGMQGAFYYFAPASLLLLISSCKNLYRHRMKSRYLYSMAIFFGWVLVGTIVNFSLIDENRLAGRSGIEQYIRQVGVILLGITSLVVVVNKLEKFRGQLALERGLLISAILTFTFCLMQWFASIHLPLFEGATSLIGEFTRLTNAGSMLRISGFKPEPSVFSIWFALVYPSLLIGKFAELPFSRVRNLLLFIGVLIVFLSASRTAMIVFVVESLIIFLCSSRLFSGSGDGKYMKKFITVALIMLACVLILLLTKDASDFYITLNPIDVISGALNIDNNSDNLNAESNIIRWGSLYAAFSVGLENPIFGVGIGQLPFNLVNHMPDWAIEWDGGRDPFTSLGLHTRVFAECGLIGFFLWIFLWFQMIFRLLKDVLRGSSASTRFSMNNPIALLASGCGLFICGLSSDSLALFEYWIFAGMVLSYFRFSDTRRL